MMDSMGGVGFKVGMSVTAPLSLAKSVMLF